MIHVTDGQTDKILAVISDDNIIDNVHRQSLEDTLETFDFTTFGDENYVEHLTKRNRVIIPSEDKGFSEFIIEEVVKQRTGDEVMVEVFAVASYLELKKTSVIKPQKLSRYTPSIAIGWTLNGSEWRTGEVEIEATRTFDIEAYTTPFAFLKTIANRFEGELRFRVETNGNRVTGRYVDLLSRQGAWRGREIEFGRDLMGVKRTENTENIYTALIGLGPEREDGSRLEVEVEDYEALQRWGRVNPTTGELMHLIDHYEPQSDRQEMTTEELIQYTRTELNKRINEVVTYEIDVADLEHIPGLDAHKIRFGDTIKIKDTKFNPPLYVEARVFEQERSITNKEEKRVKLGDFTEYTEEEVQAIWRSLQEQIRNRVSHYEMVEYTYDKLTIDDKDETVFEEGKSFAEATGITAEENAKAFAAEADEKVKTEVVDLADQVSKQYADSALEQAKQYAVAKQVYDKQMDKIAADMAEKAGLEYIDGKLVDKANKGDVYTKENVDNMINNTVSKTQYKTDQEGIVKQLESHGTRIGQNTEAIGLKADSSKLNDVEKSLTTKIGNIEVKADKVTTQVSEVRADLDGLEIGGRNLLVGTTNRPSKFNFNGYNGVGFRVAADKLSELLQGGNYTVSGFFDEVTLTAGAVTLMLSLRDSSGSAVRQWTPDVASRLENGESGRIIHTFIVPNLSTSNVAYAEVHLRNASPSSSSSGIFREVQLEKGNKATDWTPSPEDMEGSIKSAQDTANRAEGKIDGLEVGGRNLYVKGSSNSQGWSIYKSTRTRVDPNYSVTEWNTNKALRLTYTEGTSSTVGTKTIFNKDHHMHVQGAEFIASGYIKNLTAGNNLRLASNGNGGKQITVAPGVAMYFEIPMTISGTANLQLNLASVTAGVEVDVAFWNLKVEKGNKATDWTPAPEDTDEAIGKVSGRVETLDGEIKTVAGEVALKASKSVVDSLTKRVSTAEGELKVLPGQISGKVSKDGAFGELNLSPDKALLDFERVNITGKLEAKHIKSLAGLNVNDQFVVDSKGKVTIGNNRVTIDDKGIKIIRPDGATWMEDGMVNNEYSINGYDPYLMTYGEMTDSWGTKFKAFDDTSYDNWYTQQVGVLDGRGVTGTTLGYKDVRDPDLGNTVRFQRYEFVHSARYLKVTYQIAVNSKVRKHGFRLQEITAVPSGAKPIQTSITFADGDRGTKNIIVDLGKPSYTVRRFDIRLGWLRNGGEWGTKDSILRFRIPRIVQTDIL